MLKPLPTHLMHWRPTFLLPFYGTAQVQPEPVPLTPYFSRHGLPPLCFRRAWGGTGQLKCGSKSLLLPLLVPINVDGQTKDPSNSPVIGGAGGATPAAWDGFSPSRKKARRGLLRGCKKNVRINQRENERKKAALLTRHSRWPLGKEGNCAGTENRISIQRRYMPSVSGSPRQPITSIPLPHRTA